MEKAMGVKHHQIQTEGSGQFSYLAYAETPGIFELRLDHFSVQFNCQTARQLIDLLGPYVEDDIRMRGDYFNQDKDFEEYCGTRLWGREIDDGA